MPGYDGTGPQGSGKPGRGFGPCGKSSDSTILKIISIGIPILISVILKHRTAQIQKQGSKPQIINAPYEEISANATNEIENKQPVMSKKNSWFKNIFRKNKWS